MAIDIKLMVKCLLVCDRLVMFMPVYAMYWKIYADLFLIKSLGIENKGRKKKVHIWKYFLAIESKRINIVLYKALKYI